MESRQTGRVIFILAVLAAAFFFICPQPQRLFRQLPWSSRLNLKPGIDMVGGTSLLYQIKSPEGGYHSSAGHTLAEDVMESLKKRVDPNGLRNLIWRPQGQDRLEIQIPASAKSADAEKARAAYAEARRQLEATNVPSGEVIAAVETLKGVPRAERLRQLAGGDARRQSLFAVLANCYDSIQKASAAHDAAAQAVATDAYEKRKAEIESSNIEPGVLEADLDNADPAARAQQLDAVKKQAAGFAAQAAAVDRFISSYDAYSKLKGTIDDAAMLKQQLRGSGVLEFHIGVTPGEELPMSQYEAMVQRLRDKGPRVEAGDQVQWFGVDRPEEAGAYAQMWNGKPYVLCWITPDKSMVNGPGIDRWALESAFRQQDQEGGSAVGFRFDPVGARYFSELTGNNRNKELAAILDGKVISMANINSRIGAEGIISKGNGGYDDAELGYLVSTMNAGSLPAQLEDEPISERTVGPQLGVDNLKAGLLACGLGLAIVAVFLVSYYYLAGLVATFAVFMNVVLILGTLAAFDATFTLPGIAGIVLTIGAAVDANVLIFERLREEQHRGLSLRMAMRNAYSQAASAIIDSNATTVITSIILIWLGSEEVKGFGLTLLIGLISSLFTALFVTRTIFNVLIDRFGLENLGSFPLTFPKWDRLLKPNIDWMKLVPYFATLSGVLIVAGMCAFVTTWRSGQLADIDFASGTQVQFELKDQNAMDIAQLRAMFTAANNPALPSPSIQSVNNDNRTYEIITPNINAAQVRSAVLAVVGSKIKAELPSKFDHVGEPLDAAMGSGGGSGPGSGAGSGAASGAGWGGASAVVPIEKLPLVINGFTVPHAENYIGGAAIVLNHLSPPLNAGEIEDRLDRQRLASEKPGEIHDFTVVSPSGREAPASLAIILTSDPTLPYDKDVQKWRENLVQPLWQLVNDTLNRQAQLQKVNNFDPQVAGDTQQAAILALILSSLVIMGYIWFRFGNLKYGTATVLAMIHDTLLVVGGIGLSHWLVRLSPPLARLLLVEPFRVNLTIVAAVLTIMSYSMIDTIVVFDRIRENRGRFGHLSRKIINDSVNQTLSRTLLTCGTTIVTVAGMYVVGGPGIHGFTFVLLVGILVGTYSSIAIAAPILLIGAGTAAGSNGAAGSGRAVGGRASRSLEGRERPEAAAIARGLPAGGKPAGGFTPPPNPA
jgi:SecD/SecF fusion protein